MALSEAKKRAILKYKSKNAVKKQIFFYGDTGKELVKLYMDYIKDQHSSFAGMTKKLIIEKLAREGYRKQSMIDKLTK